MTPPKIGDTFVIEYPFIRDTYQAMDEDGCHDVPTWRPGVRFEEVGPEDCGAFADGKGTSTFKVEGFYKPGRFPARVFFTREFCAPDGYTFGRGKLHIWTLEKFRRLTSGYQYYYEIETADV